MGPNNIRKSKTAEKEESLAFAMKFLPDVTRELDYWGRIRDTVARSGRDDDLAIRLNAVVRALSEARERLLEKVGA